MPVPGETTRVYIIGHPAGREPVHPCVNVLRVGFACLPVGLPGGMHACRSSFRHRSVAVLRGRIAAGRDRRPAAPPLYQRFLSNPNPLELVAAKKVDRVAWTVYDEGKRNAYTAAAPAFTPVRLTQLPEGRRHRYLADPDLGRWIDGGVLPRHGAEPRTAGSPTPSADPDGAERAIWAVKTAGGPAWRVAEGTAPELSPDGSSVLFVKEGEIYRARISPVKPANPIDRGEKPFIRNWGTQSAPRWSPDGKKIAFVSNREDHSFIAVYDVATRAISYMAPSVDFDTNPMWTADGRQHRLHPPAGPAVRAAGAAGRRRHRHPERPGVQPEPGARRARQRQDAQEPAAAQAAQQAAAQIPGLMRATFRGGYTLSIWKADVATTEAEEVWHNEPNDRLITNINNPPARRQLRRLSAERRRRRAAVADAASSRQPEEQPARPADEWDRYYSLNIASDRTRSRCC